MHLKAVRVGRVRPERLVSGVVFLLTIATMTSCQLPLHSIENWAQTFGQKIQELCISTTALEDIRMDYLLMGSLSVDAVDGKKMAKEMKEKIEKMLQQKVSALQKLVVATEEAFADATGADDADPAAAAAAAAADETLNMSEYRLSKRLDRSSFPLRENQRFNYLEVNTAMSTVHVPTNIFDESIVIRSGISWSKAIDDVLIRNYEGDETLTWQYFCSTTGFLRFFPGALWQTTTYNDEQRLDTFDCRARSWYIQAAAYPKDVVILLDSSGSMKGLRSVVAKATVSKLLDTLGADDYVNVMTFSDSVKYLDSCFNGTMVQATDAHKKRLKEALQSVEASNIADLALALEWGFELLKSTNESGRGSLCNRALMIVTDGAGDTFEQVFQKYNWPQLEIRVFTYLIGREIRDTKNVLWMACRNKGKLSHFSSLADVHEHFQDYVHILSRPVAISRAIHSAWSNVYLDVLSPGLNLLMTTVAQPVFDIRTGKRNEQRILGVVGTDVPIKDILKLTAPSMLGVNGYSFAVTSNGHVIFHPKLNNEENLEQMDSHLIDIAEFEIKDVNSTLRNKLIDRKTETLTMKSVLTYDKKRRATVRDYIYYITAIDDTPFSLGIAIPQNQSSGLFRLNSSTSLQEADLLDFSTGDLILAPWNYCKMDTNESKQNSVELLLKYLTRAQYDPVFYEKHCDKELIGDLLFDVEVSRNVAVNWRKADFDGGNETNSQRNGVELVFMGTRSGLTRYLYFNNSSTKDRDFVLSHRSTVEATYYTRAVLNGNGILTFSVPFRNDRDDDKSFVVTVSTPVSVNMDGEEAMASVVGLQMKYPKFYEFFMSNSRECETHESSCLELTCDSAVVSCYLLDDNGYVVLSKEEDEVGQFFGEIAGRGAIMNDMIIEDGDEGGMDGVHQDSGIFRRMQVIDYHALCDVYTGTRSSSSSGFLIEPCRNILFFVKNFIHEVFLFMLQFNFFNWYFSAIAQDSDANVTDSDGFEEGYDYSVFYEGIDPKDKTVEPMMMECARMINSIPSRNKQKLQQIKNCFDEIRQRTQPRFIGRRSCMKRWEYFAVDSDNLPQDGTAISCRGTEEECANKYSVNRVPHTNLILVVVDVRCSCAKQAPVSAQPSEVIYNKTYECQLLQTEVYRKRPHGCHAQSTQEDFSDCGAGNSIHLALPSLYFLSTLACVLSKYPLVT